MILDERIKRDEIEKRKIILANANELAKLIREKGKDSEALRYTGGALSDYHPVVIDTGGGEEKYYTNVSNPNLLDYSNNPQTLTPNDKPTYPSITMNVLKDRVVVRFRVEGQPSFCYALTEDNEGIDRGGTVFSKAEGDTFIERLMSIEDEYCSQYEPELAEKYKECFNVLKGMLQPFVVQDLQHETEDAKYRREIKEKIESLERELAEKKQSLEEEKKSHDATKHELESSKAREERLVEEKGELRELYDSSQRALKAEQTDHEKTKTELRIEQEAHRSTKSELETERAEHSKTKQFLSALGESVKAAAASKLPKSGKAFFADIKEKYSAIIRGKGLPEKDDVLTK